MVPSDGPHSLADLIVKDRDPASITASLPNPNLCASRAERTSPSVMTKSVFFGMLNRPKSSGEPKEMTLVALVPTTKLRTAECTDAVGTAGGSRGTRITRGTSCCNWVRTALDTRLL